MTIQIKVKTGQKVSKIEYSPSKEYSAQVKSLPTKNKANLEVIDLVSEFFNVPRNKVKIKLGKYSHNKTVYVDEQFILI